MFGLNLEADGWAAILAAIALFLRVGYSCAKSFKRWATDAEPNSSISMLAVLLSGVALGILAAAIASLLTDGIGKPTRIAMCVGIGFVNFIAGIYLDITLNLRLSRFVSRMRAFRVPRYREELSDPDPEKKLAAAMRLFFVGRGAIRALPELLAASRGESSELRTYALLALWRTGSDEPDVQKAALSALFDPDLKVRAAAAITLVRFKHPPEELLAPLCDGLAQLGHQIAISSYEALVELGPAAAPALPALRELALAANYSQISGIAYILGKIGPESVPVLIEVLESGNKHARHDSAIALGEMGDAARPALPALRRAMKDSDLLVRTTAEGTLRKLGANVG